MFNSEYILFKSNKSFDSLQDFEDITPILLI